MITWNGITATLRVKSRRISRISYHLCYFNINFQFILTKGRSFNCYEIDQDSEYLEVNFNVNFKNRTKGKKESTFIWIWLNTSLQIDLVQMTHADLYTYEENIETIYIPVYRLIYYMYLLRGRASLRINAKTVRISLFQILKLLEPSCYILFSQLKNEDYRYTCTFCPSLHSVTRQRSLSK